MSAFSFWHRLEVVFYKLERFCHNQRNKAFDRDLDREFKRCEAERKKR